MVSLASHVGGACSPFVVQMTRVNAILPFAFMGGLSFIAAFFCWFLPETLGKRTPEVMEDTEVKKGTHIRSLEIHCLPEYAILFVHSLAPPLEKRMKFESRKSQTMT